MCPSDQQLQAYFDRELSADARAEVEAHVKACAACQEQLRQLQAMSAMFAAMESPRLSQMSRARLHKQLGEVMDRGLVRLAWSLSGIAAAVLVGGLVWLQTSVAPVQAAAPQAAPPWVDAMVSSHPLTRDVSSPAAEYYLADASLRVDEVP